MMALQDSLANIAVRSLNQASRPHVNEPTQGDGEGSRGTLRRYDSGNAAQPDSWLLEKCWQSLADGGFGSEAYAVAALAELRQPLAPIKVLYRLSLNAYQIPSIVPLVQSELLHNKEKLFGDFSFAATEHRIDYLLHAAACAALIGETLFAISCLERLDQLPKGWDRVFVHPNLRHTLAETIAHVGITPLTCDLIDKAILRFNETGANFLHQTAISTKESQSAVQAPTDANPSTSQPVLRHCVRALQRAVLGSLHSRKIAASVFAQASDVENLLEQVRIIATIQDAHRETNAMLNNRAGTHARNAHGAAIPRIDEEPITVSTSSVYNDTVRIAEMANITAAERSRNYPVYRSSLLESNSSVIRQVSRTSADTDVDFLVYTLKEAVESLSLEEISEEKKQTLINQLAALGLMSDGWTAAGATSALLTLGGVDEAIRVVTQIDPRDPTRVEGVLALVNGLLERHEVAKAQEQSQRALAWVDSLEEQSPGRTLRRSMASAYIEHNLPEAALAILGQDKVEKDWRSGITKFFSRAIIVNRWLGSEVTEEQLHAERVLFAAHLKQMTNHLEPVYGYSSQPHTDPPNESVGPNPSMDLAMDGYLPADLDSQIHDLSSWAPKLLDGEALVTFYRDSLLIPLLAAGKIRYAWGLLPHMQAALLSLQSNKMSTRLRQICLPMAEQIVALREQTESTGIGELSESPQLESPAAGDGQPDVMAAYLTDFMVGQWQACAERGVWPTIYAIDGCLSAMAILFGPEPIVEIAQATAEQGALWGRGGQ